MTQEYVQDNLNTTTVVVLQVLFHYEIIYMKWAHQCQKNRLKSLSPMPCSLSAPKRGRGMAISISVFFYLCYVLLFGGFLDFLFSLFGPYIIW